VITADVRTTYDVTGKLKKGFSDMAQDAITKLVFDGEGVAKQAVTDYNAIDTGALKSSIYAAVPGESHYGPAKSEALSKRPDAEIVSEHQLGGSAGRATGLVAVGVAYGVYVNFGTAFMGARPFWTRAVDSMIKQFGLTVGPMLRKRRIG